MPAMEQMVVECLDTIEALQSFTRRGTEPEDLPPAAKVKVKAKNGKTDPRIAEFLAGWENAYQELNKETYPHGGAKDTQAIKRLLLLGSVDELLDTAWEAWKHPEKFNCAQAVTIAGFVSRYANVKVDLKLCKNGGRQARTEPPGVTL